MRTVALTFDDGPDPMWTPRVLDALAAHGVRATFFVMGARAAACPGIVARMGQEGHVIGVHCDQHVRHSERDENWASTDVDRALARLEQLGVRPTLWRTPWGDLAPWTARLAADRGLALMGWNADTHDWRGDDAQEMLGAVARNLHEDAVVLAHDGLGPGARRTGCDQTVAFVRLLLTRAHPPGIRFATLDRSGRPA